jgi:hypothetical protein
VSGSKLLAIGATTAVLVAVVAGLVVTGSPGTQRMLRQDERRVSDLRRLANSVSRHYDQTRNLPDTLDDLVDGQNLSQLPRDPATDEPYGYEALAATRFRLCAEFALEARTEIVADFWTHDAGPECFDFDYSNRQRY